MALIFLKQMVYFYPGYYSVICWCCQQIKKLIDSHYPTALLLFIMRILVFQCSTICYCYLGSVETCKQPGRGRSAPMSSRLFSCLPPTEATPSLHLAYFFLVFLLMNQNHGFVCLLFYVLVTSKVVSEWLSTFDSAHSWRLYSAALLRNQAVSTMT